MMLIKLDLSHANLFTKFYEDFLEHDPQNSEYYRQGVKDFSAYIRRLNDEEAGVNLRPDYVSCTHRWLLDDNNQLVGAIRLRHHINNPFLATECGHIGYDIAPSYRNQGYGKQMLKLALPIAKTLALESVLIVADEDNLASRAVIEANGGKLQNIVMGEIYKNLLARYWVPIFK